MSAAPEVTVLRSADVRARQLVGPRLLLASDGVWDLWTFDEVAGQLKELSTSASAGGSGASLRDFAQRLCEQTRSKGEEYFGEAADNLTGVLVDLSVCLL